MTRAVAFSPTGERVAFGGSPQVLQTGESYQQVPYVNVQHPHDLFMGLAATACDASVFRGEEPDQDDNAATSHQALGLRVTMDAI